MCNPLTSDLDVASANSCIARLHELCVAAASIYDAQQTQWESDGDVLGAAQCRNPVLGTLLHAKLLKTR